VYHNGAVFMALKGVLLVVGDVPRPEFLIEGQDPGA
jgi:hypothetical protein